MERQYHNEKTKRIYLNRTAGRNRRYRLIDGDIDACTAKSKGTGKES
jgi:hypothetical protein